MAVRHYDIEGQARSLTFSCYGRLPLLGDPRTRDAFVCHLERQRDRVGFRVIAWVVMPEHVHVVVLPRDGVIAPVLRGVKQGFARETIARWKGREAPVLSRMVDGAGVIRFWQRGGGYDRNVRDHDELVTKINYVHENPVRRGLVGRAEEWAWSSVHDYRGGAGGVEVWKGWNR